MSDLSAFLNPAYTEKKIEFAVGDRFLDVDGNPVKIVMKALTQEEIEQISKRSTHEVSVGGTKLNQVNDDEFLARCLIASMVFPDLTNRDLCLRYKTEDPVYLPRRMFLADEFKLISAAFAQLCGLESAKELSTIGEVTKN